MVAVLLHGDLAFRVAGDEDRPIDRGLLVSDDLHETVEILRRCIDGLIARDQDVRQSVSHLSAPSRVVPAYGRGRVAPGHQLSLDVWFTVATQSRTAT
jgi:hypothetical protein